jgi:hypothetical protein
MPAEGRGADQESLEAEATTLDSTSETHIDVTPIAEPPAAEPAPALAEASSQYRKAPYSAPEKGTIYEVRDQSGKDRIVRVISKSPDGTLLQVEKLKDGVPSNRPFEVAVDSLAPQLIKDVGDGPFRAGKYEQAFLTFEQLAMGFNSAVTASRREIADGRRRLTAEKGNLSGKEIQERTAAFIRSEQLIHTAEREFSTILEGLRMYLRAEQG